MSSPRLLRGRASAIDAWYAVTTVTHARQALFLESGLAALLIAEIRRGDDEGSAESAAWIVMPDHLHWLFRLRSGSLSRCVQAAKSRSARSINAARGSSGPVWQAGFHDHRIRNDLELRNAARYLVANPLRRGLVERPEDYPHWWCRWIQRGADL